MGRNKPACGMRDFSADDLGIRRKVQDILEQTFRIYDFEQIQTPIVETMSSVKALYGEEFNKLVFKIESESEGDKEKLLLRYDHTVPFARYVCNNGIVNLRRYTIGPVYRKDHPQVEKGRFREFYQCDCDIVGSDNGTQVYDVEILCLLVRCLSKIIGNNFTIEMNNRKIVYNVLEMCSIDKSIWAEVCSSLDKLDKRPWDYVRNELIEDRKLSSDQVDKLQEIYNNVKKICSADISISKMIDMLTEYIPDVVKEELNQLFTTLEQCGVSRYFKLDLFLIRGLDYYTGIIFEAKYNDLEIMESSIASGGRYDEMIGKLGTKGDIPAIGISFGFERIVTILQKLNMTVEKKKPTVYVATIGKNMVSDRLKLVEELRGEGISTTTTYKKNPKMASNFNDVFERNIKYMLIIGSNEIEKGTVMLKDIEAEEQTEMTRSSAIQFLKEK